MKIVLTVSEVLRKSGTVLFLALSVAAAGRVLAQDEAPGPLGPPPEHNVRRVVGVAEAPAPPSLPPAQIIKNFSIKEDEYLAARPQYAYRKSIRIQEFGPDGKPTGEYKATYDAMRASDGRIFEKAIAAPESTLEQLQFEPEDVQSLFRIPPFPLTSNQLSKYVVQYLGTETVDEVDCYIFQVNPKTLDRQHSYFDGVIWVDQKYLEVVKTYGKWVTDLGEVHPPTLPFSLFETYRENVDGKYWFPDYARAEATLKLKDRDVPIRVTIKWTNFKAFSSSTATPSAPTSTPAPAPSAAKNPAKP
jgi:hypothetical protein